MNLQIEYVHDIDCSWCPINYANLQTALKTFDGKINPEIEFLPYQVKPGFPEAGELIADRLMAVNGWTQAQHEEYRVGLLATAKAAGVKIDFSKRTHYYNTEKAHRLMHFASLSDKHVEMNQLLIEGYFSLGLELNATDQLLALASRLGLNAEDAAQALESQERPVELNAKYTRAKQITERGVPAIRINQEHIIKGAKAPEYFENLIARLIGSR